jgi:hypothetical protein
MPPCAMIGPGSRLSRCASVGGYGPYGIYTNVDARIDWGPQRARLVATSLQTHGLAACGRFEGFRKNGTMTGWGFPSGCSFSRPRTDNGDFRRHALRLHLGM